MHALFFGSGKIARGFVSQLLYRSGFEITFVDVNEALVNALNERGRYYVNVMGNAEASEWITGFHCVKIDDYAAIAEAMKTADIGFTSVGGKNLDSLAKTIAAAYEIAAPEMGNRTFTIITCENWKDPGTQLYNAILETFSTPAVKESFAEHIGVSEAAILRSGVEATQDVLAIDPYAVSVTDYWELPVDKKRIKGTPVEFTGVNYKDNFGNFLQEKVYTFNTTNATIAYIGRLRGIEQLKDAANDPEILEIVAGVHSEINPAISEALNVDINDQIAFSQKALNKYKDRSVTDFTERHARDPLRKLGPNDRIVGTLRLVEKCGGDYSVLATTLAAALYYPVTNPADPSAQKLHDMRVNEGIDAVMQQICGILPDEKVNQVVKQRIEFLREKGWLHE